MSQDVNHVILIGRLTRDAELKYTSGGMAVCKFAIAVNKRRKQGEEWVEEASFFDIVLWGRQGESLNQYLVKGKQVAVEGELHQNRWEKDGQTQSKIEIMANNVQLLGGDGQRQQGNATDDPAHIQTQAATPYSKRPAITGNDGTPPDFPDDIPF
jgi:single stranded DNA-binding protein (ssb)